MGMRGMGVAPVVQPTHVALGQQHTPASITGTATPTALFTLTIPAGTLGKNDSLRITTKWSMPNSVSTKTIDVLVGGVSLVGALSLTLSAVAIREDLISNRNSLTSQICGTTPGLGGIGSAFVTSTRDFSQAQTITAVATLGLTSDTITLESILVEQIKGV